MLVAEGKFMKKEKRKKGKKEDKEGQKKGRTKKREGNRRKEKKGEGRSIWNSIGRMGIEFKVCIYGSIAISSTDGIV